MNSLTATQSRSATPKTSKQPYYTVQVGTFRRLQGAKEIFYSVSCPEKRIEKINDFFVVRCGLVQDKEKAIALKKHMKAKFNDAVLISTFPPPIIKSRTVLKQSDAPNLVKPPFFLPTPNQPPQKGQKHSLSQKRQKTLSSSSKTYISKLKKRVKPKVVIKKTRRKVNKEKINALLKKAYFYLENEQVSQALEVYNEILEMNPSQIEALLNRGIIWQNMGAFKKAENDFLTALKLKPDDSDLLNALGVNYLKLKQYKKAEEYFLKAGNAKAMINLAILHWQRGEFEKVGEYLNKALVLSPDDPYVHYYLGLYYQTQQNWAKANKEFALCKQLAEEKGVFELLNKLKEKVY